MPRSTTTPTDLSASAASASSAGSENVSNGSSPDDDATATTKSARKECKYRATIMSASRSDCVLASTVSERVVVNPQNKEQKTRLLSIKGVCIKNIQLNTLRDAAQSRFGKYDLASLSNTSYTVRRHHSCYHFLSCIYAQASKSRSGT